MEDINGLDPCHNLAIIDLSEIRPGEVAGAVTFRPMFEFASGELEAYHQATGRAFFKIVGNGAVRFSLAGTAIVGNALRFATHAEAYGNARHKFRFRRGIPTSGPGRHIMPLNFSVEKSLDAVNYKWSENEGTVAI